MDTKKFCENCREDVDYYIKDEILKTMYNLTYPGQVVYCKECNMLRAFYPERKEDQAHLEKYAVNQGLAD